MKIWLPPHLRTFKGEREHLNIQTKEVGVKVERVSPSPGMSQQMMHGWLERLP
jgi:hypothetical protein